jgi:hypothetical protein
MMIEPILLVATRVATFDGQQALTNATGFSSNEIIACLL